MGTRHKVPLLTPGTCQNQQSIDPPQTVKQLEIPHSFSTLNRYPQTFCSTFDVDFDTFGKHITTTDVLKENIMYPFATMR